MEKQLQLFLATDYSESVKNAERYAVQFAERTSSKLTMLHVYEIPFNFPSTLAEYAKATEKLREYELRKLKRHCERLLSSLDKKYQKMSYDCMVLEGSVGKQVSKEAKLIHADIIITGTHGVSGLRKFFLGSHTWDIIKRSEVPVLAVPEDASFMDIKNIVFASEYRNGEIPGIRLMIKLAKEFDAHLTVLHISNDMITKEFEKLIQQRFLDEIKNENRFDKFNLKVVHHDDVIQGINNYCARSNADWVVMSHAKPFFLEKIMGPSKSVTREMSFTTHTPMLAVPDFYTEESLTEYLRKISMI